MTQAANQTNDTIFDEKIETLIAIGAATACNCIPCFEHLYEKAITSGLAVEQIQKASAIAGQVKKGADATISKIINEMVGNEDILASHCNQTANKSCCG
jgi:alkylhydroperoxidase/carboxymuconolactone decarboxylase family protein YurZ